MAEPASSERTVALGGLVDQIAETLRLAGIETPRREARLLVEHATGHDRVRQLLEPTSRVDPAPALALARRRSAREPMAYLMGKREFWGLDFAVGPGVLVPRPETETLIEVILAAWPDRMARLRVLDLGTGSGCILLTLLTIYPNALGVGVDRAPAALHYARRNCTSLALAGRALLVCGDWLDPVEGPFDLVVANPPYIAPSEPRDAETAHEPATALLAGGDGLAAYRAIATPTFAALAPGGRLVVEIGATQADAVTGILHATGFVDIAVHRDLAGHARAVSCRRA